MTDYYQILGLPAGASATEVKNAYHKLALKYHPDKNPNNTNAEYIFKQITEAYNCLSNPADKLLYDMQFSVQQQSLAHVYRDDKKYQEAKKQQVTPTAMLTIFQNLRREVARVDKSKIDPGRYFVSINNLLSIANIDYFLSVGDIATNRDIVFEAMACCKPLPYFFVNRLVPRLVKLAGADNETIVKIYGFDRRHRMREKWIRYLPLILFLMYILINVSLFWKGC